MKKSIFHKITDSDNSPVVVHDSSCQDLTDGFSTDPVNITDASVIRYRQISEWGTGEPDRCL